MRIKISGYYEVDNPEHIDDDSPTGLTEEAYDELVNGDGGPALTLGDLEDLRVQA